MRGGFDQEIIPVIGYLPKGIPCCQGEIPSGIEWSCPLFQTRKIEQDDCMLYFLSNRITFQLICSLIGSCLILALIMELNLF